MSSDTKTINHLFFITEVYGLDLTCHTVTEIQRREMAFLKDVKGELIPQGIVH